MREYRFGFRLALVALVTTILALGPAASSHALEKGFWGPTRVEGRSQFPIYKDLGVTVYQSALNWSVVAPTQPKQANDPEDPAYQWPEEVDFAIKEARRYRIKVALMIVGAPPWANGGRDSRWAPKRGDDFGKFAEAASRRYPDVRFWMVWGEPTREANFQPMDPLTDELANGTRLTARQKDAAQRYSRLIDAAYGAVKRVNRSDLVIGGMTFSGGDIRTYNWVRNLKLSNGRPPRMDMWGHNPFSFRKPDFRKPQSTFGVVDFSDLPRLARLLDTRIRRPDGKPLPLYISEFALPTGPDAEFNYYLTPGTQASWIRAGIKLSRRFRRIHTYGYIHLYDDPPRADGGPIVQSGLLEANGAKKPGYGAFKKG